MEIYTFLCVDGRGLATSMDLQLFTDDGWRRHAALLLRAHRSANRIEVWRGDEACESVARRPTLAAPERSAEAVQGVEGLAAAPRPGN